jgi:hypothetical protein
MRHVTGAELATLRPSEEYEWVNKDIISTGGSLTLPMLNGYRERHLMFQCLRCEAHYLHEECPNCGATVFCTGPGGVFCIRCDRGFTEWNCSECGTSNPTKKTLYLLEKGGCFIATAVYGSYDAPEVGVLRHFRDAVLATNLLGRRLVRGYCCVSPPIARLLGRHCGLCRFVRAALMQPIVRIIRWRFEVR